MNEEVLVTESADETQRLGEKIVKDLKGGDILALFGDLGSGKTTFVQGLAKGLGIKKRIISPTFIIIRKYELRSKIEDLKSFYHIDLYRIETHEIEGIGLDEIINNSKNIVAVEWAEKIKDILPDKRWNIFFSNLGGDKRKITIWKR